MSQQQNPSAMKKVVTSTPFPLPGENKRSTSSASTVPIKKKKSNPPYTIQSGRQAPVNQFEDPSAESSPMDRVMKIITHLSGIEEDDIPFDLRSTLIVGGAVAVGMACSIVPTALPLPQPVITLLRLGSSVVTSIVLERTLNGKNASADEKQKNTILLAIAAFLQIVIIGGSGLLSPVTSLVSKIFDFFPLNILRSLVKFAFDVITFIPRSFLRAILYLLSPIIGLAKFSLTALMLVVGLLVGVYAVGYGVSQVVE